MKAEIKEMVSGDADLETFRPDDKRCFGLSIEVLIGAQGEIGSDIFQILICTPEWLRMQYRDKRMVWGRHMLIVFEYDFGSIKSFINDYVDRCEGDSWESVAEKLSRIAHWEFEDYQP